MSDTQSGTMTPAPPPRSAAEREAMVRAVERARAHGRANAGVTHNFVDGTIIPNDRAYAERVVPPVAEASGAGDVPAAFVEYVVKNYPTDTVIGDPAWHAPKLWRAAVHAMGLKPVAERPSPYPPPITLSTGGTIQYRKGESEPWFRTFTDGSSVTHRELTDYRVAESDLPACLALRDVVVVDPVRAEVDSIIDAYDGGAFTGMPREETIDQLVALVRAHEAPAPTKEQHMKALEGSERAP